MKHKQALIRAAKYIFMIIVVSVIFIEGKRQLSEVGLKESLKAIDQVPFLYGYHRDHHCIVVCFHDVFFTTFSLYAHKKIPLTKRKIFGVAWVANSFNGVFGFGGLIGAGVRGMLYKGYTKDSAKLVVGIGWLAPAAVMGLSIFSILVIMHVFPAGELLADKKVALVRACRYFFIFPCLSRIGSISKE
ncbi:hypothetical protein RWE15_13450 [Virgibacillus halophilus]|uniref:Uncharacterized protein n=1 Tax=Tigheibacillus halophilus TaxID=361280 RepID=A0ABU5C7D9_9BACI|nr:hypothetical protein [Virgibacillus halophilus]